MKRTGGFSMSYTREQRLDIGKQIYNNELSKSDAAIKYKISEGTARDYMRLYQDVNNLPPKNKIQKDQHRIKINTHSSQPDLTEYETMTKYELTLYMDLWNNEILSHGLSAKRGDRMTYISGLNDLIEQKKQHPEYKMIPHSDQGSVYASKNYNELLGTYNIIHSMSRAGTPTDNAAMESINGWIKAEIFMDFHITGEKPVEQEVADYILFFNTARPAYSLNYLTSVQYQERYAAKE